MVDMNKSVLERNKRRAIIRYDKKGITILCNVGHLLERNNFKDMIFAGSMLEANLSFRHEGDIFDRMARGCQGTGHND